MGKAMRRANGTGTVYKLAGRRRRPWVAAKQKNHYRILPYQKRCYSGAGTSCRQGFNGAVQHDLCPGV